MGVRALVFLAAISCTSFSEEAPRDLKRPENRTPYTGVVIEWVSQSPLFPVKEVGDMAAPPAERTIVYTAHLRNLAGEKSGPVMVRWLVDGVMKKTAPGRELAAGERGESAYTWESAEGRHWIQAELVGSGEWLTFATDALMVKLAVEKKTLEKYEAVHGSFARRFQDSFAGLHASWSAVRDQQFAPEGIAERLRLDAVEIYGRGEGDASVPKEFWNHPSHHLFVACDQGGPNGGFYLPGYSIGHNYAANPGHESLFSDWGENCLWHEIAHFRGVQDFYIFPTKAGDIGKTDSQGVPLEGVRLRPGHEACTMNNPYKETCWSDYATAVLQAKRGVARVGRCEDRENTFGHMWRHIPAEITVQVIGLDGKPRTRVDVEIYRPVRAGPENRQRVAADATPLFQGAVDEEGRFVLGEDPFGRQNAETGRALWILVVMKRESTVRARYVTLLDANLEYWKGHRTDALFLVVWYD